ncbi:MAG: hypothetical protein FWF57_06435 [Defluviitaleaceae bacterium]|nr:hypothetical protein [Defluviitaleaceae bacterium]
MIEKMSFINIVSHKDNRDKIINYFLEYDIHVDYVLDKTNIYSAHMEFFRDFPSFLRNPTNIIDIEKAVYISDKLQSVNKDEIIKLKEAIKIFENYSNINVSIAMLSSLSFIKYKFGYIPVITYGQIKENLRREGCFFYESEIGSNVYFLCFFTNLDSQNIEILLKKYNFVEQDLNEYLDDNLFYKSISSILKILKRDLENLENESWENKISSIYLTNQSVAEAYNTINFFYIKKILENMCENISENFILYKGYMSVEQAVDLDRKTENIREILFWRKDITDENAKNNIKNIPVKLKNNFFVKPFEFFVKSYSHPLYNEIDASFIIAVLYPIFFGLMFGDVGQGAFIIISSIVLKPPVRNIGITIGISSMFFGFMYGSIFGFEHIIPAFLIIPATNISNIILFSVFFGVFIIILSILVNVFVGIKQKDYARIWEGPNSLVGLLFYIGLVMIYLFSINIFTIIITFPFFAQIILEIKKEPKNIFGIVIETFEYLLAYITNTFSFIRIGAIILSHSAMMGAVFMLTRNFGLLSSILFIGLGNIFVMSLEIMISHIQAIRLNYYEVFSRFYRGGGKEFISVRDIAVGKKHEIRIF